MIIDTSGKLPVLRGRHPECITYKQKLTTHEILDGMIEQMNKATHSAEASIDETLQFVSDSNARIKEIESKHKNK